MLLSKNFCEMVSLQNPKAVCIVGWSNTFTSCRLVDILVYRSGDIEGLHCVECHPTHPHLAVTGRSDGSVCFWDLRHHRQPLSHMEAHTDIGVFVCACMHVCMYYIA